MIFESIHTILLLSILKFYPKRTEKSSARNQWSQLNVNVKVLSTSLHKSANCPTKKPHVATGLILVFVQTEPLSLSYQKYDCLMDDVFKCIYTKL